MKQQLIFVALFGILLSACTPSPSADVVGVWKLVSYGKPTDLTRALPGVDTSIEFKSDGTVAGNVGCNGFGGGYELHGDAFSFEPMVSTEMYCEAVDQQEATVLSVLEVEATFVLDGDLLTLTSAKGSPVIVLKRK
jgi:heat shock protein HslJ